MRVCGILQRLATWSMSRSASMSAFLLAGLQAINKMVGGFTGGQQSVSVPKETCPSMSHDVSHDVRALPTKNTSRTQKLCKSLRKAVDQHPCSRNAPSTRFDARVYATRKQWQQHQQ